MTPMWLDENRSRKPKPVVRTSMREHGRDCQIFDFKIVEGWTAVK
jgi:hypothetical protein